MPEITVLMPVRNGERYIKESIDSVLNQTLTDFEFLIIDDGSTDRTVEIIQGYTVSKTAVPIFKNFIAIISQTVPKS